jgi:hypothetical protein
VTGAKVFVVGNHRSGTALFAAMLASTCRRTFSAIRGERSRPTVRRIFLGVEEIESLVAGEPRLLAGDIVEASEVALIAEHLGARFPEARFCHLVRDPRRQIRSVLQSLGLSGRDCDWRHLHHLSDGWRLLLEGKAFGLDGGNYVEVLARHWNLVADVHLRTQDRSILVRYERFIASMGEEVARGASALGLGGQPVSLPAAERPVLPVRRRLSLRDFFGPNLALIDSLCDARMQALGYA